MALGEKIINFAGRITGERSTRLNKLRTMLPNGVASLPRTDSLVSCQAETAFNNQINISPYQTEKISLEILQNLGSAEIVFVATDAGAGHLRPALALIAALLESINCLQIPTISTRTHRRGSRELRLMHIINFVALHKKFQNMVYAPISRQLLLSQDGINVINEVEKQIRLAINQSKKEIVFIHTNPDPAYIAGFYKHQLEQKHDVKITNVVVITDHFFSRVQCIWALIDADIIVAPDHQTKKLIQRDLLYWCDKLTRRRKDRSKHLPKVIVCAFPQDPSFGQELSGPLHTKRKENLSPDSNKAVNVAIPLGGAAPGMPFLADLSKNLRNSGKFNLWTLFKQADGDQETQIYEQMMKDLEATTQVVTNNQQLIQAYSDRFNSDNPPDVVIVKPGELSNQTMFDPSQVGGAIFLFTEPVGDQEVQNLLFFQSEEGGRIIPDEKENQALIGLILQLVQSGTDNANDNPELKSFQEKAKKWRGLSLPRDPQQAALFIVGLKKFGIFAAMSLHQRGAYENNEAMSTTGFRDFFYILDHAYGVHQKAHVH